MKTEVAILKAGCWSS